MNSFLAISHIFIYYNAHDWAKQHNDILINVMNLFSAKYIAENTQQEYTEWLDWGKSDTFTVKMPEEAEIGDRIAILFSGATAYDSWSSEPQNDYGGYVWYAWIYTYTKNA